MKHTLITLGVIVLVILSIFVFANKANAPTLPIDIASSTSSISTTTSATTTPPTPISGTASNTAILKLGQEMTVNGLRIKAVAVYVDSRCPSDVQCFWAGRVRVGFSVFMPSGWQGLELENRQEKFIRERTVMLDEVTPDIISTKKIADNEYRFKITVVEMRY